MKQRVVIGLGAVSLALGSVAFAAPASADCPTGTVPTRFPGVCTAGQSGGGPPQVINPGDVTTNIAPNQIPSVNGVPCNLQHQGTCWGFAQNG